MSPPLPSPRRLRLLSSCACAAWAWGALLPPAHAAEVAGNVAAVTDYRYRGISQSRLKPSLQLGLDVAQGAAGWYFSTWGSTIQWIKDAGGDAPLEIDVYGGHKGTFTADLGYDVGGLAYLYPRHGVRPSPQTFELYGALTFGAATVKYSHALTNAFGVADSRGSGYLDVSASFDVGGGVLVAPHVGWQRYRGPSSASASYRDLSLTVSKDFGRLVPSLALVATDADKAFYVPGAAANSKRFLGRTALVAGIKFNF